MRSPTSSRSVPSGCIRRTGTATGGASTTSCGYGRWTTPGSGCSPPWWPRPTRMKTSPGPCPWTPPSCALISTRPGPAKRRPGRRAGGSHHRPVPRAAAHGHRSDGALLLSEETARPYGHRAHASVRHEGVTPCAGRRWRCLTTAERSRVAQNTLEARGFGASRQATGDRCAPQRPQPLCLVHQPRPVLGRTRARSVGSHAGAGQWGAGRRRTGRVWWPLLISEGYGSKSTSGTASSMCGKRSKSRRRAVVTSMRARGAPRQKWTP